MIAEFYKDCEIFITGGSGVVGKAAIEKLLRSCDVKKIYILLRPKSGRNADDRLENIKNSKIFKVLKQCKPNELDKLVAIPGDVIENGLGISQEDVHRMRNVSVVFHSAATTRFDEPLRRAILLNLKSTLEALKLAETGFKNLKIFCHVSTFFSNPYLHFVGDEVYPTAVDWQTTIKLLDHYETDSTVDGISTKLLAEFPNTYLFTKNLAEKLVDDYRYKLPVCIFRPSIVTSALNEPEPGFTESKSGFMGMICVWALGILQLFPINKGIKLDCTPLDINSKVLLICAARIANLPIERMQEATKVQTFSSRGIPKYKMPEIIEFINNSLTSYPFSKAIWIPHVSITENSKVFWILTMLLQVLPSTILDGLLWLFGQKPFLMHIQRTLYYSFGVLSFFLQKEYDSNGMTDEKEILQLVKGTDFDVSEVMTCFSDDDSASKFMDTMIYGIRKFIMDDDDSTLERCRKILRCKKIAYNLLRAFVIYYVGRAVYRTSMAYMDQFT